jgi:hypothetical protein
MRPFVAAVACLVPLASQAYVRTTDRTSSACLFWPTREVRWSLNEKGSQDASVEAVRGALERSFAAWTAPECSDLGFRFDGLTSRADTRFDRGSADNVNLVVWRESRCELAVPAGDPCLAETAPSRPSCADTYDCWDHGAGIIALTSMNYSRNTGVIWDGDIEFNGSPDSNGLEFRFSATLAEGPACANAASTGCVATDVQNTATHEIGHLLGFAHSPVVAATMFASAPFGEAAKRSLEPDDIAALCDTYPADAPPVTCTPSGRIVISAVDDDGGCASAPTPSVALALAAGLRRRERRRRFRIK